MQSEDVTLRAGPVALQATLLRPPRPIGLVAFAHGSGSSRFSERNLFVARELVRAGLSTLLLDLLTPAEERDDRNSARHRFDIPRLAERVVDAVDWAAASNLPIGLFGASTGAAAALVAAVERPRQVRAVVSRGGRPDLAAAVLPRVRAPTLLVAGGNDPVVLDLNEAARRRIGGEARLEIVLGASHLFEEPGALERVAQLASAWFVSHLRPAAQTDLIF